MYCGIVLAVLDKSLLPGAQVALSYCAPLQCRAAVLPEARSRSRSRRSLYCGSTSHFHSLPRLHHPHQKQRINEERTKPRSRQSHYCSKFFIPAPSPSFPIIKHSEKNRSRTTQPSARRACMTPRLASLSGSPNRWHRSTPRSPAPGPGMRPAHATPTHARPAVQARRGGIACSGEGLRLGV
ncbi:hypothetical protein EJ06DRAFT_126301 [Trichodelitschia bisporula]|uniref:Uncharacterized protein n=1 Tax=Trichodelitschia bisporula TaxID=703511 RepID=A0A6G1HQ54_9PEZI|nr:hypothetical protein EJ06DRAFT_126301 [Trichodelitschia bisporula]